MVQPVEKMMMIAASTLTPGYLDSRLVTGCSSSDRYCSAEPLRHLNVRVQSMYMIRSGTCSQCRSFSNGVIRAACYPTYTAVYSQQSCISGGWKPPLEQFVT